MADEAFALSPISARAAQPSEEDYDAISEAFMETSRGRWFLGEYAKRNRNADTRMVLDAVARIEQTLAAQKQPEPPVPTTGLPRRWPRSRPRWSRRRAAAVGGARRPRARSNIWRRCARAPGSSGKSPGGWREIGADGRICDLIDSQVSAIEAGCGELATIDPARGLSAAFDLIEPADRGVRRQRARLAAAEPLAAARRRSKRRSVAPPPTSRSRPPAMHDEVPQPRAHAPQARARPKPRQIRPWRRPTADR